MTKAVMVHMRLRCQVLLGSETCIITHTGILTRLQFPLETTGSSTNLVFVYSWTVCLVLSDCSAGDRLHCVARNVNSEKNRKERLSPASLAYRHARHNQHCCCLAYQELSPPICSLCQLTVTSKRDIRKQAFLHKTVNEVLDNRTFLEQLHFK
jgi:hypothetical protein